MVGYHKNDSITVTQKLIAGCVAGSFTRFVTQPLDVIKIRVQLQKKEKQKRKMYTIWSLKRLIFKEEGLKAFWHGHFLGQLHSMLSVGSQFYTYELMTKYVALHGFDMHKHQTSINYLCGSMAGSVSCTLVIPLEVIRVRQMLVNHQYQGLISGARAVYKSGGVLAFYEGLTASLIQIAPASGTSFAVFTLVQSRILHYLSNKRDPLATHHGKGNVYEPKYILMASAAAGAVAGVLSKTLVYPFELAKRRLQIKSHVVDKTQYKTPTSSARLAPCSRLFECLAHAYRSEGLRGLYRGWTVTMLKAKFTSLIAYTTYELTCYAIREVEREE